jgi:D-3-phosphoglycerate dehydrogenase
MNTPGQNANAVAELAIGMMVYHTRKHFDGTAGKELKGKTLGLHAYGNVGKNLANIAKGFGMKIYAYDPFIDQEIIRQDGIEPVGSVEELYNSSQYISLHIPANEKTKGSINYQLMSMMPENATLVNTARKEVVNEDDLVKILTNRDDFNYLSDIAPDIKNLIEEKFPGRFFFTPKKMGAQTAEANINAGIAAARQIVNYIEKGDETFKVN